jgi:hypothetical protein
MLTPFISDLIQIMQKRGWWVRETTSSDENHPINFARLCKSRADFIMIINEVINSTDQLWNQELIDRVIRLLLDRGDSEISVYSVDTLDSLDYGHAIAVIAEGISQEDFRSSKKGNKRKPGCTRGSLLIPATIFSGDVNIKYSPHNNLNFHPASKNHYDLEINNLPVDSLEKIAKAILDGIYRRDIAWSFLGNEDGSYRLQAVIAYSYCLQHFGKLDPNNPSPNWEDGRNIDSSEQINTLQHLAKTTMIDSPNPPR